MTSRDGIRTLAVMDVKARPVAGDYLKSN